MIEYLINCFLACFRAICCCPKEHVEHDNQGENSPILPRGRDDVLHTPPHSPSHNPHHLLVVNYGAVSETIDIPRGQELLPDQPEQDGFLVRVMRNVSQTIRGDAAHAEKYLESGFKRVNSNER